MVPKQLIIIGGGETIKEGIDKGLWQKLEGKFTLGLNYSYNFFDATAQVFVDEEFYQQESQKPGFKVLPLIIGQEFPRLVYLPNTIQLKTTVHYNRDISRGVYKSCLCGLFGLTLGIHLLDEGEIFLLGFDFGAISETKDTKNRAITHFYQGQIEHEGIGKNKGFYTDKERVVRDFAPYSAETKIKIYNVSLPSRIVAFPKISYDEFFSQLHPATYNQNELRSEIITKLKEAGYGKR